VQQQLLLQQQQLLLQQQEKVLLYRGNEDPRSVETWLTEATQFRNTILGTAPLPPPQHLPPLSLLFLSLLSLSFTQFRNTILGTAPLPPLPPPLSPSTPPSSFPPLALSPLPFFLSPSLPFALPFSLSCSPALTRTLSLRLYSTASLSTCCIRIRLNRH
jgi:hypothetical protein